MLGLLIQGLRLLTPSAVKLFSQRASIALGHKLPQTLNPLIEWFKRNPTKSSIAISALLYAGEEAVERLLADSAEVVKDPLANAIVQRYLTSSENLREIERIVGDGDPDTVNGVEPAEFFLTGNSKATEALIAKAIAIAGSKHNLTILRDFFLTVEPRELDNYGR